MTITTLSPAAAAQKVRRWVSHDGVADVFRKAYLRARFSDYSHSFSDISFLKKQSPRLTLEAMFAFLAMLHDVTYEQFDPIILHPRRTRVLQGVREEAAYRRWRHCVETPTKTMAVLLPEIVYEVQKALHEQGLLPEAPELDPKEKKKPPANDDTPAAGEGDGGKPAPSLPHTTDSATTAEAAVRVNDALHNGPPWSENECAEWLAQKDVPKYTRDEWRETFGTEPGPVVGNVRLYSLAKIFEVCMAELDVRRRAEKMADGIADNRGTALTQIASDKPPLPEETLAKPALEKDGLPADLTSEQLREMGKKNRSRRQ